MLDADTYRADLELRLIKLLLKDGARVVPRIAAREMHERSPGFSVISQKKGLFQHNRRIADIPAPGSLRAAHAAIQTAATKTSIGRGWSIT